MTGLLQESNRLVEAALETRRRGRLRAVFKNGKLIERPTNQRVVISKSRDRPILSPIALPGPPQSRVASPGYAFRSR
jgi:hypothetical protein